MKHCLSVLLFLILSTVVYAQTLQELQDVYTTEPTVAAADAVITKMKAEGSEGLVTFLQTAYADLGVQTYAISAIAELRKAADYSGAETYAASLFTSTGDYAYAHQIILCRKADPEVTDGDVLVYAQSIYEPSGYHPDVELAILNFLPNEEKSAFAVAAVMERNTAKEPVFNAAFLSFTKAELEAMSPTVIAVCYNYAHTYPIQYIRGARNKMPGMLFVSSMKELTFTSELSDVCVMEFNRLDWMSMGAQGGIQFCNLMLLNIPVEEATARLIMVISDKRTILQGILPNL